MVVQEGDPVPEFSACTNSFSTITHQDFGNKTVVLSFFPAAFSGSPSEGCEMQLCGMNAVMEQADKNILFYGVSGDLPFANKAFGEKHSLNYELLSDPGLTSCERYVGLCNLGQFLSEAGVGVGLKGVNTSARGCVIIKDAKVVYAFSGGDHPGKQPDMKKVRELLL